jgi:acetyl-CoA C-acetyltransferase
MKKAVIVSAVRTPFGSFGGSLRQVGATDLGALVIKESVIRAGIEKTLVNECIMGMVLPCGYGQNPAKQAAIKAELPQEVEAITVNKVCGSALKAVMLAAQAIQCGDAEVIVAGGMESMSTAPYYLEKARWGHRMGPGKIEDRFAEESYKRALRAVREGVFKAEIVPVPLPQKKGETKFFDTDECPQETSYESLQQMRPAFKADGVGTAGNASVISDGAAAVVVMSREKAGELGCTVLAEIGAQASAGIELKYVLMAPILAIPKVLKKEGISLADIDLFEINEAFSGTSVAINRVLELNSAIVNVNGGAVAMGHPIGASGARLLVSILHEMGRRDAKRGLVSLCLGGGEAVAMVVNR